jgi:hypothetical protein
MKVPTFDGHLNESRLSPMQSTRSRQTISRIRTAPTGAPGAVGGLGLGDLCKMLGVSRSTVYAWVADGAFPKPIKISNHGYYPKHAFQACDLNRSSDVSELTFYRSRRVKSPETAATYPYGQNRGHVAES